MTHAREDLREVGLTRQVSGHRWSRRGRARVRVRGFYEVPIRASRGREGGGLPRTLSGWDQVGKEQANSPFGFGVGVCVS